MNNSIKEILAVPIKYIKKIDWYLLVPVGALCVLSVFLLYSMYYNEIGTISSYHYKMQALCVCIGGLAALVIAGFDYHKIAKLWWLYAPVTLILMGLTFTSMGIKREGADDKAWLDLGFITMQPSELLKIVFILTFSYHIYKVDERLNSKLNLVLLMLHGAVPIMLTAMQGDYGTCVIFIMMFVIMLFAAGIYYRYIIIAIVAAIPLAWFSWEHILGITQKRRFMILLHPGTDPLGVEYQQNLGLASLGVGKTFGLGLFNDDKTRYRSVPELQNDFIFTYVGQVFGFAGAVLLCIVLMFICIKLIRNGRKAKDILGKQICVGAFALLFTHCFLNIGMCLKVMPVIGVPLPFVSAGGTAMASMLVIIGLVLSTVGMQAKAPRYSVNH
ncbi:MAG: FtsW/RodA/SpoVE family cell cycle protein [Ruminococcus sp.]|jgi:rod shape determining protein RodA|nr:FtsW/RodA/SpoVE family cell cycle protein [Ruminococcus sp.]